MSVVIPTRNRIDKLARCLDSVCDSDYRQTEVIVVDDASDRPVGDTLSSRFPNVNFIRNDHRRLLSCSRNAGAAAASGEFLFFLDDDNVLAKDAIRLLAETLDSSDRVAVSSPVIYYLGRPDVVWTSYISRSPLPGFYALHTDVPASSAATFSFHNSFMVKKRVFDELHGFDCAEFPVRFAEVDFAHRLNSQGYVAVLNPHAKDWHDLGWALAHVESKRAYYTERNRMIVIKRYYPRNAFRFYCCCLLPFLTAYYLLHHPLSSSDGRLKTASSFLKGVVSGLTTDARTSAFMEASTH